MAFVPANYILNRRLNNEWITIQNNGGILAEVYQSSIHEIEWSTLLS